MATAENGLIWLVYELSALRRWRRRLRVLRQACLPNDEPPRAQSRSRRISGDPKAMLHQILGCSGRLKKQLAPSRRLMGVACPYSKPLRPTVETSESAASNMDCTLVVHQQRRQTAVVVILISSMYQRKFNSVLSSFPIPAD